MKTKNPILENEILNVLRESPNKALRWSQLYQELHKRLGIGKATLTSYLKDLEKNNKIRRNVSYSSYPPQVYYELIEPKTRSLFDEFLKNKEQWLGETPGGVEFIVGEPNEISVFLTNKFFPLPHRRCYIRVINKIKELRKILVEEQKEILTNIIKQKKVFGNRYREVLKKELEPIKVLILVKIPLNEEEFPQLRKFKGGDFTIKGYIAV